MKHRIRRLIVLILVVFFAGSMQWISYQPAFAQYVPGKIAWSTPINLSNTPTGTSTDPFLVSDASGFAHLFWAEKVGEAPGSSTDTIIYCRWDGYSWSQPVDLFFAPMSDGNPVVGYPHAVVDASGIMHLIWISEPNFPYYTLNYSRVAVGDAGFVQAWSPKVELADNLSGTKYSIHIILTAPNTLHIAYAIGATSGAQKDEREVAYIRSTDGGLTWSAPLLIFTTPNFGWGVSDIRLVAEEPDKLYVSWTLWDTDGLGSAIYFSRSLNLGESWDTPIILAEKLNPDEYERDWNALAVLGPNHLATMWEGGFRAYRFARYSEDAGVTWSEPVDLFPWLIGENGYAEFARDSNGLLHLFIAQRHREGTDTSLRIEEEGSAETLWHSVYLGDNKWSDPIYPGGYYGMINPKVVIVGGNKVVATFYVPPDLDIMVMTGVILDAPALEPVVYPNAAPLDRMNPTDIAPVETAAAQTAMPQPTPEAVMVSPEKQSSIAPGTQMLLSVVPVLIILPLVILFSLKARSSKQ